jgi:hypothetical protein
VNLCLIYLTEWVRLWHELAAYPQRWIVGSIGFAQPEPEDDRDR